MARRVNSKFLIIFCSVGLLAVAVSYLIAVPLQGWFKPGQGKKAAVEGDKLVAEADALKDPLAQKAKLEAAEAAYEAASGADTRNIDLHVKLGDVYNRLAQYDAGRIDRSRKAWERALELNPDHLPALRRLEKSYYDETQIRPTAYIFSRLEEKAAAIHKLDPKDLKSYSRLLISPLNQWLSELGTPQDKREASIEELSRLIKENPTAPEVADMVFFSAATKVREGVELKKTSQDKQGNELIGRAMTMFTDAIKANDKDGPLRYRFFELLTVLAREDADREQAMHYTELLTENLQRARELIKPDQGQSYVKANLAAQQLEAGRGNMERAERILNDLQAQRPNDQRVRLARAKLIRSDPKRMGEAIDLLDLPIEDSGFEGVESRMKGELEVQTWSELANLYVERFQVLKPEERVEELKRIERTYDKIYSKVGDRSFVLKLKGKVELLRGGADAPVRAIKTFEEAQHNFGVEKNGQEDLDLTYLLARAYVASGQTTQAKQQLQKFYAKAPRFVPVRLMLAKVLIGEGEIAAAREHVNFLEGLQPDEPEVLGLVLAVLTPKETDKIKSTYAKLPEQTRAQKLMKAQVASLQPVNDPAEGMRLYREVLKEDPADFQALQGARDALLKQNKKAEAVELLKAARAARPEDSRIAMVAAELEGATPAALVGMGDKVIRETFKDPFAQAVKLYEFYSATQPGNPEVAFPYLEKAEKLNPDDARVMDLMFQHYMGAKDWAKCEEYVRRLAEKNADQANGLIYRFRLAMAQGKVEQANKHATDLTTAAPFFARGWVMRGQALQALGQFQEAIDQGYSLALDKQAENPEALAGMISCYYQQNKTAEAGKAIDLAIKSHPTNPYFKRLWQEYQMQNGDPSAVIKPATEERDANPGDRARWIALGQAQYAAARKRDDKYAGYIAAARATFEEALKKFPDERRLYAFVAEVADFDGHPEQAEALLKGMVARPEFKETPEAMMMLADHLLRHNKAAEAEAMMRQAIGQFKDNNDVRRRLAAYYTQKATKPEEYQKALDLLDPASPDRQVQQQVVEIYMLAGAREGKETTKFVKAEQLLRGLLASPPKDPQQHAQLQALLGVVLLNMKKETLATEALATALSLDPKNQAALYSRSQLRLQARPPQVEEALRDLLALREANPGHVDARVALGEVYRLKGQADLAQRELELALRLAPGRRDIRISLAGLYAGARPPLWADAERLVTDGMKVEPTEPMWVRMLAKIYSVRAQHEKAALTIREAIALDAKNEAAAAAGKREYKKDGNLVREYFDILETGKNWDQLLLESNGLIAQDPKTADTLWWLFAKRAVARRNKGQTTEAMADFEKALAIEQAQAEIRQDVLIAIIDKIKENLGAPEAIARVLTLVQDREKAKDAEQAARWRVVLGYLYFQNRETNRATATIQQAIAECQKLGPKGEKNLVSALNVAGTIYMLAESQDQFDQAKAIYEQLLVIRNDDLGALNNMACIMAEHTSPANLPKAIEYCERAVKAMAAKQIQEPNVLDTYGWAQVLIGGAELDKGVSTLQDSLKAGEIPEAHFHLAEAMLTKGFPVEAKKSLERASQMVSDRNKDRKDPAPLEDAFKKKIEDAMVRAEKAIAKVQ